MGTLAAANFSALEMPCSSGPLFEYVASSFYSDNSENSASSGLFFFVRFGVVFCFFFLAFSFFSLFPYAQGSNRVGP